MEFPRLDSFESLGFDTETNMLQYWSPDFKVLGVSLATEDAEWYWPMTTPGLADWLRDILPGRKLVAQNAQFDYQGVRTMGIDPRSIDWYCTMVSECLIFEHHLTYDLESIAGYNGLNSKKSYWLDRMATEMGLDSHRAVLAALDRAPPDLLRGYGSSDARDVFDIGASQTRKLAEQDLWTVHQLEMDLLPVLADMSWVGVRVNLEAAHATIPVLTTKIDRLQAEIDQMVGRKFNVNSSPQIRAFFQPEKINNYQYRLIDGTLVGPTKGGTGPSLDQHAMREIKHPLAALIMDLRKTIKLRDTFVAGHVIASADGNGYVHTSFNQTRNDADAGTVTGRLSSTDPALQQITKRDKENAAILRAMFLPDPGEDWLCADYSQVDFRCGAHLIGDPNLIQAYRDNPALDYHQVVSDMTGIPRNPPYAGAPNTKQINLGMQFGAGAGKVAFMMGMPYTVGEYRGRMAYQPGAEAKAIFDLYHQKLPGVAEFRKHAENVAKTTGYVKTMTGRRLRFPRKVGAHKAAGLLFQAYAADLHKYGLIRSDKVTREEKHGRLMMSCHDEIGVSMEPDPRLKARIVDAYCDFHSEHAPLKMKVPITASGDFGPNWYEASK